MKKQKFEKPKSFEKPKVLKSGKKLVLAQYEPGCSQQSTVSSGCCTGHGDWSSCSSSGPSA